MSPPFRKIADRIIFCGIFLFVVLFGLKLYRSQPPGQSEPASENQRKKTSLPTTETEAPNLPPTNPASTESQDPFEPPANDNPFGKIQTVILPAIRQEDRFTAVRNTLMSWYAPDTGIYSDIYRHFGLSGRSAEQLRDILVARRLIVSGSAELHDMVLNNSVSVSIIRNGIPTFTSIQAKVPELSDAATAKLVEPINAQLRDILGNDTLQALDNNENMVAYALPLAFQLNGRLAKNLQLNDAQIRQLAQVLQANDHHYTDGVLRAAHGFLRPDQLAGLTRFVAEQIVFDQALEQALAQWEAGGRKDKRITIDLGLKAGDPAKEITADP